MTYLDLMVTEVEDDTDAFLSCLPHHPPDPVTPVRKCEIFGDFDLEQVVVSHEGGHFGGAQPSATTNTYSKVSDQSDDNCRL